MNNLFGKWVAALLLLSLLSTPALAQGKIATVDVKKIFDNYWKKKAAQRQIDDQKADIDKEEKNMQDEFKQVKDDYDAAINSSTDQNISPEERDKRKKLADDKFKRLRDLQENFKSYDASAKTRLVEQGQRMEGKIIDEIRGAAAAKAKAQGFALVLDTAAVSGSGTPICLYSNGENDMTDAVLLELNRSARDDTGKSDEKPTDKKDDKKKDAKK